MTSDQVDLETRTIVLTAHFLGECIAHFAISITAQNCFEYLRDTLVVYSKKVTLSE